MKSGVRGIREIGPGEYEITSDPAARGPFGRLRRWLLGKPLSNRRERRERLTWIAALAILGADIIASSVYGPEEMLRVLSEAGPSSMAGFVLPLAVAIVALLAVLAVSYWQTIGAYPNGAGGYIVAGENLGRLAAVVSASALLLDYTLDVAVSVASGVQSATSALPLLAPWHVQLALLALAFIALANLRGIRTAGTWLSLPIYVYIGGTALLVLYGMTRWAAGTLPPYSPPPAAADLLAQPTQALGVLLLLRAFSSGAVALTGIEAVSNGVPYFKPPEPYNAHRTLIALTISFGALFLGISFLAGQIGIVPDPTETETLHSQLTRVLIGAGPLHVVLEGAALLLLILAADTGFADFPRLLALLSRDGYLPSAFAQRGARLAFSNGIVAVALISAVLIVLFHGSVSALVPLFTVGAFLAFTLSQAGMARHWWTHRRGGWHWRLAVNAVGAAVTAIVLVIVIVSKFVYGAWIVVVVLPILALVLRSLGQHHARLLRHVRVNSAHAAQQILEAPIERYYLVSVGAIDKTVLQAVAYARTCGGHIEAVHCTADLGAAEKLRQEWDALGIGVPLVILESPYRATAGALVRYLDFLQRHAESHAFVTLILPEVLPTRWWHPLLHNWFAWRMKWLLLFRPRTAVTSVPYYVRD